MEWAQFVEKWSPPPAQAGWVFRGGSWQHETWLSDRAEMEQDYPRIYRLEDMQGHDRVFVQAHHGKRGLHNYTNGLLRADGYDPACRIDSYWLDAGALRHYLNDGTIAFWVNRDGCPDLPVRPPREHHDFEWECGACQVASAREMNLRVLR